MKTLCSAWFFWMLSGILLLLNGLDVHSTLRVVRTTSVRSERNPLARWLMKKLGVMWGLLILKTAVLFALPLLHQLRKDEPVSSVLVVGVADLFYLWVVVNNYRVWKRAVRRKGNPGFTSACNRSDEGIEG